MQKSSDRLCRLWKLSFQARSFSDEDLIARFGRVRENRFLSEVARRTQSRVGCRFVNSNQPLSSDGRGRIEVRRCQSPFQIRS
jgi:hypothetical protein